MHTYYFKIILNIAILLRFNYELQATLSNIYLLGDIINERMSVILRNYIKITRQKERICNF